MGNCVTNRTKVQTNFEKSQKLYIHQSFIRQTMTNPNSRSQQLLFEENFIEMFDEIPFLGQCMYWFLSGIQDQDQKGIEFDTLLQVSEIFMLGKSDNICIPNRVALITVMITLYGQLDILHGLRQFGGLEITYLQIFKCMQVFVSMILRKMNPHEQPIKAFVDSIFAKINGNVSVLQFIKFIDTYLPQLEEVVEDYFYNKFLGEQKLFRNPILSHPSHILNQEWVALMYLYFLHKDSNKLELLYSTNVHERNFELLTQLLTDCNQQLLFILQVGEGQRQFNFGSYTNFEWKDDAQPNGSKEDCIFQMIPQFKVYKTKNVTRSQYTYLNSKNKELRLGLGFGGELAKDFRLFISSDLKTVMCKTHDKTYESGDLMQAQVAEIQILEIWSVQQIQGTTYIKDLIQQKIDEQIEYEEFEQPQVHLDEDISSYRSGEHSLDQFVKKDSCDWDGESQHEFEEEIIIRNDGFEEIKKNEQVFEVVNISNNNNTSIKFEEIKPQQVEQNQFEEVVIQTSDKMDSSALQMVYNVVSGTFGEAESDDWNGDNSDWKGNGSTSKNKVQLSKDLATITEELKESTNTQY